MQTRLAGPESFWMISYTRPKFPPPTPPVVDTRAKGSSPIPTQVPPDGIADRQSAGTSGKRQEGNRYNNGHTTQAGTCVEQLLKPHRIQQQRLNVWLNAHRIGLRPWTHLSGQEIPSNPERGSGGLTFE